MKELLLTNGEFESILLGLKYIVEVMERDKEFVEKDDIVEYEETITINKQLIEKLESIE